MNNEKYPAAGPDTEPEPIELTDQDLTEVAGGARPMYALPVSNACDFAA